jgi:hypothetical protein
LEVVGFYKPNEYRTGDPTNINGIEFKQTGAVMMDSSFPFDDQNQGGKS